LGKKRSRKNDTTNNTKGDRPMKLTIRRKQADVKGFFGGHKGVQFSLFTQVDIKAEERALIDKYKVGECILASYEHQNLGGEKLTYTCTVDKLINGHIEIMRDLAELQKWEEQIKSSCRNLKTTLEVMATFGGEEVIDI
jgi:hypothetical protein